MKKLIVLLVLCLAVLAVFSSGAVGAEIEKFLFYGYLPNDFPRSFLTEPGVINAAVKPLEIPIDIPGMKKIEKFNFVYAEYGGKLPKNWSGMTVMWNKGDTFWPIYVHIAVREGSHLGIIYQKAYNVGFLKALCHSGIALPKIKNSTHDVYFYFGENRWSLLQLEEAVAEVGFIRGAKIEKKPKLIRRNFQKILKTGEGYGGRNGLAKMLIAISKKDEQKYLENLGILLSAFLEVFPKEEKKSPEKINFDWKVRMIASRK